jgi:hypothetical protein
MGAQQQEEVVLLMPDLSGAERKKNDGGPEVAGVIFLGFVAAESPDSLAS